MRDVTLPLQALLDLVCATRGNVPALYLLAQATGYVTDEEIQAYADWFVSPEGKSAGMGEEDREAAFEWVTDWRDQYCIEYPSLDEDG